MNVKTSLVIAAVVCASPLSVFAGPKIGLLLKDHGLFYTTVENGAIAAARAAGATLIVKTPPSLNNPGQQHALLDGFMAEKLDALVIAPLIVDECMPAMEKLKAQGVKIVVIDTPPREGLGNVCIDFDQGAMVIAAAKAFTGLFQQGEETAMLRANSLETFNFREKTFVKTVKGIYPNAVIHMDVMAGAVQGDDFTQSGVLLARHPKIKAVATLYTTATLGMIRALKEKKLAGKIQHLGFGSGLPDEAFTAIEQGDMQVWIAQQPRLLGKQSIEIALKLLAGESVPAAVYVEHMIVTPANLQDPQVKSLRN
jgi:ribose transport system substrate-binding protein